MGSLARQRFRLSGGTDLSFIAAGEPSRPAVLLLHGLPNSASMFRDVIPVLSQVAYVIAPDLPGFGESDLLPASSFPAYGEAITELLERLSVGQLYIFLHDFGAPVGFHIAMQAPDRVSGLIIQNANAHRTGMGPQWATTEAYWSDPNPENEKEATKHLSFEGTREQYVAGVPPEIATQIPAERWEEDWRVMSLPGRLEMQRAILRDYGRYVDRFDAIADYLKRRQPPALLLWGRHDIYFELAEVLSFMEDLPRMEAHVFDAGHLLLETHGTAAAPFMRDFVARTSANTKV